MVLPLITAILASRTLSSTTTSVRPPDPPPRWGWVSLPSLAPRPSQRRLWPPERLPLPVPLTRACVLLGLSLLANPPTKQLRPLVIARYVHYSEAYVRVEGLTVEVDVVDRHALASVLTWRHLVGDLL